MWVFLVLLLSHVKIIGPRQPKTLAQIPIKNELLIRRPYRLHRQNGSRCYLVAGASDVPDITDTSDQKSIPPWLADRAFSVQCRQFFPLTFVVLRFIEYFCLPGLGMSCVGMILTRSRQGAKSLECCRLWYDLCVNKWFPCSDRSRWGMDKLGSLKGHGHWTSRKTIRITIRWCHWEATWICWRPR
jgi:hypothetical protein